MTSSRERILDAGAELFRRRGYHGTGVKQIVNTANAPFASLYHFFPGGKAEFGVQVIRTSGAAYLELIDASFGTPEHPVDDVESAVRDFFAAAATTLAETDYAAGCPIATVALEVADTNERLRKATAEVFDSWLDALAERFEAAGLAAAPSRELAVSIFCLLEGAFILCQAGRSTQPLDIAGAAAVRAAREALSRVTETGAQ